MDLNAYLSPHATLREALRTSHIDLLAEQLSWAAQPEVLTNLRRHFLDLWEPLRTLWGPTTISSGVRCPELNTRVRGRPNSYHLEGLATDNHPSLISVEAAMVRAVASGLPFDEAIWERGQWVHVQSPRHGVTPRGLALMTFDGVSYEKWNPADPRVTRRQS